MKLIRGDEIKVGIRLLHLDQDMVRYYINRTFVVHEKNGNNKKGLEKIFFQSKRKHFNNYK